MRVLFTVSNWAGHYLCMVPLGWALRAAGHEVRVACTPAQAKTVASTGLTPVTVLDAPDMMESARLAFYVQALNTPPQQPEAPLPLHPLTGRPLASLGEFDVGQLDDFWKRSVAAVQRSYDNAVTFAGHWRPDLVVHDLMAVEGALVGAVYGVPSVYFSPGLIGTVETEPGLNLGAGDPKSCFAKHGVDWDRERIAYVIDPSPDVAVPPLGDALRMPIRYLPYNGSQDVDPWLLAPTRRKRVCVVWGNSATGVFGAGVPGLRHAIDAAVKHGAEVVLTSGLEQVESLGPLPPEVTVLQNCPIDLLLPDCDVLVHHGSANCYMNALVAGIPQLSVALNHDAVIYGKRLDPAGASRTIGGLRAEPTEVSDALGEVLFDHRYRQRAEALRDGLAAAPTPAELVERLFTIAGGVGPTSLGPPTCQEQA